MSEAKAVLVVGAGDATGGAIARRFAREGYVACVTRRSADKLEPLVARIRADGGQAHGFGSDARKEDEMVALVDKIESEIAPIEVAIFNIGANVRFAVTDTTERVYRKVWEMGALAGFLMGREVARVMLPRGHGTIIFTGATASVRGSAGFCRVCRRQARAARTGAEPCARAGPKGIHVAHTVIDGAIDTQFIAEMFPERYALKASDGILNPDAIAEAYWQLHASTEAHGRTSSICVPGAKPGEETSVSGTVEFFFDVGSPTAYLAYTQLPALAAACAAQVAWRPMLLGGVFKATGNVSPVTVPAKGRWMNDDLQRWARHYGVTLVFNPHFPINTLTLMRGAVGMQMREPEGFPRYLDVVFNAMWRAPRNLGDPAVLADTLRGGGFDPVRVAALAAEPEVKAQLIANTDEAVARGAFGAPTFFVGNEMFFGQDRLSFVREALSA